MGANAQTSVPAFTAGQVLTAQQQTEINTGIPVFATTTTRDAAFGGTGEKTLAEGQMAYIENIAGSSAVQYYDGAAWATLVTGGLTLIKTQTIGTAVSSVTVSDAFSATYDNYLITVSGGVASTNSFGAVTLGATATGYYYWEIYGNYNSTSVLGTNAQNAVAWPDIVGGTADSIMGAFELYAPNLAKNTHLISRSSSARTIGGGSMVFGYLANTTQYTAFTITPGSGTYTGGTIRVYGYQNS